MSQAIYEFNTPSDPITFRAKSDKVAFYCAVLLGRGKAFATKWVDGKEIEQLPTFLIFESDPSNTIDSFIGMDAKEFAIKNTIDIADCFDSFAYTQPNGRDVYDTQLKAIPESDIVQFKAEHEDRQRSSMNRWCHYAWKLAQKHCQMPWPRLHLWRL